MLGSKVGVVFGSLLGWWRSFFLLVWCVGLGKLVNLK